MNQAVAHDGRDGSEVPGHIQIHEAATQFTAWSFVLPPQSKIQCQRSADSPVVGERSIDEFLAEILVRISERDRGGIGNSQEKTGEILKEWDLFWTLIWR